MKLIGVITEDVTVNGQDVSKTIASVMKPKYPVMRHVNVLDVKMWMRMPLEGKHLSLLV